MFGSAGQGDAGTSLLPLYVTLLVKVIFPAVFGGMHPSSLCQSLASSTPEGVACMLFADRASPPANRGVFSVGLCEWGAPRTRGPRVYLGLFCSGVDVALAGVTCLDDVVPIECFAAVCRPKRLTCVCPRMGVELTGGCCEPSDHFV